MSETIEMTEQERAAMQEVQVLAHRLISEANRLAGSQCKRTGDIILVPIPEEHPSMSRHQLERELETFTSLEPGTLVSFSVLNLNDVQFVCL